MRALDAALSWPFEVVVAIVYKGRPVGDYRVALIVEDTVSVAYL